MTVYQYKFIVNDFIIIDLLYSNLKKVYDNSFIANCREKGVHSGSYSTLATSMNNEVKGEYRKQFVSSNNEKVVITISKVKVL